MTRSPPIEQGVQAHSDLIYFLAPMEELLTVAINDTSNTVFLTGSTGVFCH